MNLEEYKSRQKESWSLFKPIATFTTMPAAELVKFAQIQAGQSILDVACGTGVVAITAALQGAEVAAFDLCPVLVKHAQENISIADVTIDLKEGDAEAIPYADNSFDVVVSQFGHMFAPRPKVAITEMLRVLKPSGTLAFSTWPPDLYIGRLFELVAKFSPALPAFANPPCMWGDTNFVREQLKGLVDNVVFDTNVMLFPALSIPHYRIVIEKTLGPIHKIIEEAQGDSKKINQFRAALTGLVSEYFKDNHIKQHFLMTRAFKC